MNEQPHRPAEVSTIDVMRIMEMIPHRFPFLMVDKVVDLEVDALVVEDPAHLLAEG